MCDDSYQFPMRMYELAAILNSSHPLVIGRIGRSKLPFSIGANNKVRPFLFLGGGAGGLISNAAYRIW